MKDKLSAERPDCLKHCPLNRSEAYFGSLARGASEKIGEISGKRLYYAPVGTRPDNPRVIICGKTPGIQTKDDFWSLIRDGSAPACAARQTVYSNMRDNLYRGLEWSGLFDCLAASAPYWRNGQHKLLWDRIFTDEESSRVCGIQLTQACNCAIVGVKSGVEDSNQPTKATVKSLCVSAPDCLFESFIVTPSLRLIIFLDTPGIDNQFHTSAFFERSSFQQRHDISHVYRISITHPSGQNNDIYTRLPPSLRSFQTQCRTLARRPDTSMRLSYSCMPRK